MRRSTLRVRIDAGLRAGLDRLRQERQVNVSAWVRHRLRAGLEEAFGAGCAEAGAPADRPAAAAAPDPDPIPGWRPVRLSDGEWGARYRGSETLPASLDGTAIEVQPRQGPAWVTTVVEVLHRSGETVIVRHSGRPPASG